ncbi:hypothetical protein MtrunA17_Chr3g0081441 [Medicago truncatula]|uniref:Uncharacterized protein n=1 Tax=Medicago truncatula TaxID=3880 RepID=A0A396IJ16_MEDTR|nr:hypothetical protein MtrunA17_Chr3g0081441 [Medicago truncatula]
MDSWWLPISSLPVPYPCFEMGKNSNPYLNPVKAGKTRRIGFGSGGYYNILNPTYYFLIKVQ